MPPFPTPEASDTSTAALTENQLQRRIKLGVIMTPGLGFRDKIKVVRSVENQWDDQVERFVHDSAQVWANINNKTQLLNVSIAEWDWTEFLEFLKWLIPLLLELFL